MLAVNGLYGHIQRNEIKSGLLLGSFVLMIGAFWIGWCLIYTAIAEAWWPYAMTPFPYRHTLPPPPTVEAVLTSALTRALDRWYVPLVLSTLWFTAAYVLYRDIVRAATRARPVTRTAEPRLYDMVETLAIGAGLPMPQVHVMASGTLNAYAAGLGPDSAVVAVTRGLINTLDDDELEAVLAHEIAHIRNHDVKLMMVAAIFAGGLTLIGDVVARQLSELGEPPEDEEAVHYGLTLGKSRSADGARAMLPVVVAVAIAFLLLAMTHLLALLAQLAISRSREYVADAGAVELTKNPDALIRALSKIDGRDAMPDLHRNLRAMMFSSSARTLLSTHPAIDDRIAALRAYAGGRATVDKRRPAARGPQQPGAGTLQPGARAFFGRRASRA
jgi:heat shock protein HtpX